MRMNEIQEPEALHFTANPPYLFTTTRGDISISAQAIDSPLFNRIVRLGACLGVLTIVWAMIRVVRRVGFDRIFGRIVSALLVIAGFLMLFAKAAPVFAVALILLGAIQLVRLLTNPTRQPAGA